MADLNYELPNEFRSTKNLRIVEFDIEIEVDGKKSVVDVRLWDTTGDDMYHHYWAVYRNLVQGIVFVYNPEIDFDTRKLDLLYNYFVNSNNFNHRACLLCCHVGDGAGGNNNNIKISKIFNVTNVSILNSSFQAVSSLKFLMLKPIWSYKLKSFDRILQNLLHLLLKFPMINFLL